VTAERPASRPAGPVGTTGVDRRSAPGATRAPAGRRRPSAWSVLAWVLALAVVVVVGSWVFGLVLGLLRSLELVAVAAGCGVVGYRVGVAVERRRS